MKKVNLSIYHITWVTHNSRVSERMVVFGILGENPLILSGDEEIEITKYILQIVRGDNLKVINYNICRDHVHLLLACQEKKRDNIVRKLKGKSTQLYKENHNLKEEFHLWAQKYSCTYIEKDEHLENAIEYIKNNRKKHNLPENKRLKSLIAKMVTPYEEIFK